MRVQSIDARNCWRCTVLRAPPVSRSVIQIVGDVWRQRPQRAAANRLPGAYRFSRRQIYHGVEVVSNDLR